MDSKILSSAKFDPGILVILSLIIAIAAVVFSVFLFLKLSHLEVNYNLFMRGKNGKSLEDAFKQEIGNIETLKDLNDTLHRRLTYVERSLDRSYQKCGIVKYDAFKEIGGKLSFAYVLLNDKDSGFVINSIHSREGSYTYIKEIIKGECDLPLSDEEKEAVKIALASTSAAPASASD